MLVDTKTLRAALSDVNTAAIALCEGLSSDQLTWRPRPAKWSIAENLSHLCATTKIFLPAVDHVILESRRRGLVGEGPFHLGVYGRLLVWYVEPPPVIRFPSPRTLRPQRLGSPEEALPNFLAGQVAMSQRMEGANGLNLTGLRFPSPLASYIKMNLLEFFSVFNAHSRRHLWQAANVHRNF